MRISAFCFFIILIWSTVWRPNPKPPANTACREFTFDGCVQGGEDYSRKLGAGLLFRLNRLGVSSDEKSGWSIEVETQGAEVD
jgi:hypothetical protein